MPHKGTGTIPATAVVIGAGISGMASALILARHGCAVTLVERASRPGTTLRGFPRRGIRFESGLHYAGELSEHGIVRAYLRWLGIDDLPFADFDPDAFESFRFADGSRFAAPIGLAGYRRALTEAFPAEKDGIAAFLEEIVAAYAASPFHTFTDSFAFSGDREARWQVPLETVLNRHIADSRLRAVLTAPGWLYGVPPEEAPFLLHARVAGSHFDSVRTFEGGGRALVKAFERRLAEEGVTLLCGRAVSGIRLSSASRPVGAILEDGGQIAGECIIHTGHPAYLADMLPEGAVRPVFRNRLRSLNDTVSAHVLFFAAENCPEILRRRNLLVYPRDEPFAAAFAPGRRPGQGPFYILSGPSPRPPAGGGPPVTTVTAFAFCGAGEYSRFYGTNGSGRPAEYLEMKAERLKEFENALFAACPELAGLTRLDGATPLTLHDWLHTPQAGLYGTAHTVSRHNPAPVTRVPNVLLAGQGIVAPGLMGTIISAFLTCGVVVGHEALLREVRRCK
jgi:all-trans-retinol 13,14-reductase